MSDLLQRIDELMRLGEGITPGPWWVGKPYLDDGGFRELPVHASVPGINQPLSPAAVCLQFGTLGAMQEANAAAIAAIPKLLAALSECRTALADKQKIDAYAAGWRMCAVWANRPDLCADIGSPSYEVDKRVALSIPPPPEE